jgi:hypothetical protein
MIYLLVHCNPSCRLLRQRAWLSCVQALAGPKCMRFVRHPEVACHTWSRPEHPCRETGRWGSKSNLAATAAVRHGHWLGATVCWLPQQWSQTVPTWDLGASEGSDSEIYKSCMSVLLDMVRSARHGQAPPVGTTVSTLTGQLGSRQTQADSARDYIECMSPTNDRV